MKASRIHMRRTEVDTKGRYMLRRSNTIEQCPDVQQMQIFWIRGYTGTRKTRTQEYADTRARKYARTQIHRHTGILLRRRADTPARRHAELLIWTEVKACARPVPAQDISNFRRVADAVVGHRA